ncbi:hypothetical protein ACQKWADRAFT_289933 [Trichoderma austrokoningii]
MSPPKRSKDESEPARKSEESTAGTKRRRVSLACDACRTARERCDGGRPQCGRCLSQNRPCSYTPTSKKRGIQSGYLRAIELSLAWLLEKSPDNEETLHQLLAKDDGKDGADILMSKGKTANKLHKRWSKCRVHKQLASLLCQGGVPKVEASNTEDSETDDDTVVENTDLTADPSASPHITDSGAFDQAFSLKELKSITQRATKLPLNYRHLLNIYFSYTHCWFPILDREEIFATARICETQAGSISDYARKDAITSSNLAVLWSTMAVAAFQDAHSSAPLVSEGAVSPIEIFSIARSLIPQEEDHFDISGIQANLLHAIILIGRENMLAASLITGKAMRLISYLRRVNGDAQKSALDKLAAACNLIEVLTSICIGQPFRILDMRNLQLNSPSSLSFTDSFSPTYGFGKLSLNPDSARPQIPPLFALDQLSRFAQILSTHATQNLHPDDPGKAITVRNLVSSLDPQFSFCNSVIAGEATPMVPSAFLIQAMFLAATVELVPGQRSSLTSNFLEVVESSISNFGACGTPPIIVALFSLVQQKGVIDEMRASDTNRWNLALNTIKRVWLPDEAAKNAISPKTSSVPGNPWGETSGLKALGHDNPMSYHGEPPARCFRQGYELFPSETHIPSGNQIDMENQHKYSPVQHPPNLGMQFLPTLIGPMQPVGRIIQAEEPHASAVDYDAILEELGNIDYADSSIGMDPQFMMNLGFAPGCTLEELFHADSGA